MRISKLIGAVVGVVLTLAGLGYMEILSIMNICRITCGPTATKKHM